MFDAINGWNKTKMIKTIKERNNGTKAETRMGLCKYKTSDGNHCAVGCFIPKRSKAFSYNGPVDELFHKYPHLEKVMPLNNTGMAALQIIHDLNVSGNVQKNMIDWIKKNVRSK